MNTRQTYIDSLRGLAVILMVQQHLQSWLWQKKWLSYAMTFPEHPVMVSLNFAGNFAAPLFLLLSGMSASLYLTRETCSGIALVKRGLFIMACGYILNLITPSWFDPWSWYVLHTMGLCIMLSPLLNRVGTPYLAVSAIIFIIIAALLQTWLATPLLLTNLRMNNISMPGGALRLALVEGHFPVFPWAAFFFTGIIVRRFIDKGKMNCLLVSGATPIAAGLTLTALYRHGYAFATYGPLFRIFVYLPYFYPALPALVFLLMGTSLLLLALFSMMRNHMQTKIAHSLTVLGRSSLTWFILHIVIFNELFRLCGLHKSLSAGECLAVTTVFIFIMMYISSLWEKIDYRYGLEWLMRKMIHRL